MSRMDGKKTHTHTQRTDSAAATAKRVSEGVVLEAVVKLHGAICSFKLQIGATLSDVLFNKVIKSNTRRFLALRGYTKTSYATLHKQWHRPISKRFIKPPFSIPRATSIDSNCCRLPTTSVLSNKADRSRSNQF